MAKPAEAQKTKARKAPTKSERIIKLLRRTSGASLAELQKATGWQAHSVRGFLSGTVRKKLNLNLLSETDDKAQRRYRIAEPEKAER
ncbi:MAG: DUF3489 domain-containing protein [Pseudomonadota bacterium]